LYSPRIPSVVYIVRNASSEGEGGGVIRWSMRGENIVHRGDGEMSERWVRVIDQLYPVLPIMMGELTP
jgi:hypothetical protein